LMVWKEAKLKTTSVGVHRQRRTKLRRIRIRQASVGLSKTA
jgi:hypothetical protein